MTYSSFKRWLYRGGRPHLLAKILNRFWAWVHSSGIAPNYFVTLEVTGRKSGRIISFPLAMVVVDGERYLVSMLGEEASWVRNLRAANGRAILKHGRTEHVWLEPVPVERRAPIIKAYLKRAPGARPHIPVDKDAPLEEFKAVSSKIPVFRVMVEEDLSPQK